MLRRYLACFLAFLCLTTASGHALAMNAVTDLAIMSQWDEHFWNSDFIYHNNHFRFGGCGPASVGNGLIAALDVTDEEQAVAIMRDLLYLMTKSRPAKNKISLYLLDYLDFPAGRWATADERYPALNQALTDSGYSFRYYNSNITAQNLPSFLPASGSPTVIHGSFSKDDRWESIREIIQVLTDAGYEDARIVLSFLGAGTSGTQSPFRSGSGGHYLCVCVQMADFLQSGEFYVLDSLPRALAGEDFASGQTFQLQYDFVKKQNPSASLEEFNTLFEVKRIKPTIVQPVPIGEALSAVEVAEQSGALPGDALMPYLSQVMQFYGDSYIFITLPEQ